MTTDRTGLLIINAWIEEGSSEPLRAQLRFSNDVSAGFDRTMTLARPEEICAVIVDWLAGIVQNASQPD